MSRSTLTAGLVVLAWGGHVLPAWAGHNPPRYGYVELKWNELRQKYADRYPAVEVDDRVEMRWKIAASYSSEMDIVEEHVAAVFDKEAAGEALDRSFYFAPWVDVKDVYAWSHELGGDKVVWATSADITRSVIFNGLKEIKVAIPGLSGQGVCGVEIHYEQGGVGWFEHDFASALPLDSGRARLICNWGKLQSKNDAEYLFNYVFRALTPGSTSSAPVQATRDGFVWEWTAREVLPACGSRYAIYPNLQRADLIIVPRRMTWSAWARGYGKSIADEKLPKDRVNAARDTLSGATPEEIVHAVARYLDDPAHFRMVGPVRTRYHGYRGMEEILKTREGSAFGKAVLALTYLNGLGVKSYLVLGASEYGEMVDWRTCDPSALGAILISIPALGPEFIWDVAERGVPLGKAGPDLIPQMLVCDPDPDGQGFQRFPVWTGARAETRNSEWTLGDGGELTARVRTRIVGEPVDDAIDPWDRTLSPEKRLGEILAPALKVENAEWVSRGTPDGRLTEDSPGILAYSLRGEATPAGESGWRVAPFPGDPPGVLQGLARSELGCPKGLFESVSLVDSVRVTADGERLVSPPPQRSGAANGAGQFLLTWSEENGGVTAVRSLTLRPRKYQVEDAQEVEQLLRAWQESAGFAWQFDPE